MCYSVTLDTIQQSCLNNSGSAVPVACFLIHAPSSCCSRGEGNEVSRDGWGDREREMATWGEIAREWERGRKKDGGAGSLIPPVVRGAALLMCWGSHIVAEILSLSRHVLCACVCLCVCVCWHAVLVCCGRTSPAGVLPVNTSISQGAQSVTMRSLLRWPHGKGVLTHTHTLPYRSVGGGDCVCDWFCVVLRILLGLWFSLSFHSLHDCDLVCQSALWS